MITHLVNKNPVPQTVNIEVVYRWRPVAETEPARPAWLDIDSICNGGNSEYTIPTGLLRHAQRLDRAAERAHHRHVRPPARHRHHRPESVPGALRVTRGGDRAQRGAAGRRRQRLLRADPAQQPAARGHHGRDAVPVRGVSRDRGRARRCGRTGTWTRWAMCGIFGEVPAGAQPEAYPPDGGYSFEGYPIKAGQVIRLHSEYQNNSGAPKTDVMGIMAPWLAFPDPGYPRPKGATPMRASLVPAYNQCTSPNRVHGPPDFPGNASNPDGSCNPPAQTSGQITVGSPDANGAGGELGRLGADVGDQRQPGDHRRRGQRALPGVDHRRALQARRRGLRGRQRRRRRRLLGPGAGQERPADHRPLQRPLRGRHGPGHLVRRHGARARAPASTGDRLDLLDRHDRRRGAARRGEGDPARDLAARPGAGVRRRSRRRGIDEPATRCSPCRASSSRSSWSSPGFPKFTGCSCASRPGCPRPPAWCGTRSSGPTRCAT